MDVTQLNEGLKQAFFNEDHRVVFWYDANGDFVIEKSNPLMEK